MRISGGEARGRQIPVPKSAVLRPTSDRVRESLFATLFSVEGASFLDLFAGTGSVGLEALSRGAASATFVEKDIRLARAIRTTALACGFGGRYEVMAVEVKKGIRLLAGAERRFDVVFADPPYDRGMVGETLAQLAGGKIVADSGVVVVQHAVREQWEVPGGVFILAEQKRYGETVLSFLKKTTEAERETHEKDSGISRLV